MRLPKNRLIRFSLYTLSIAIILLATDLLLIRLYARIQTGPDTTVLTTPTLPDGRIDYLAALDAPFASGVTRDNNMLIPFIEAGGPNQVLLQRYRVPISDFLGLFPVPDSTRFIEFEDFFKSKHPNTTPPDIDSLAEHPWRPADYPDVADWLGHNAPSLELLRKASLRPRYYYPYTVGPRPDFLAALLLPDLNFAAYSGFTFLTRSMLRIETGDASGAIDDVLTAYRFVALLNQSPIGVTHNVAYHRDMAASRAARALAGRLSAADLHTLADALDHLPPLGPIAPHYDREERFMRLDTLQYLSRVGPRQGIQTLSSVIDPSNPRIDPSLALRFCFPIDYDACMRALNTSFDELVSALNQPTYPARYAALSRWKASTATLPMLLRTPIFLPTTSLDRILSPATALDDANAHRTLTRLSVALAQYKLDTGRYPASLADLSPKYLPRIPNDPYTLKPFSYHPTPAGYGLTSAGPNMTDDAGRGDDLVVSVP